MKSALLPIRLLHVSHFFAGSRNGGGCYCCGDSGGDTTASHRRCRGYDTSCGRSIHCGYRCGRSDFAAVYNGNVSDLTKFTIFLLFF